MPLLSIIIPCYNSELFIAKTIESVIKQDFTNWELIVVDDGSKDNSANVISSFENVDSRIKLIKKENGGVITARKKGLDYISADSKYLHFLDSDDILLPNFYTKIFEFWQNKADVGAVYVNHTFIDENDKNLGDANWGFRYKPTRFWLNKISEIEQYTSFTSILLWCKMVEPMVVIRKEAYYTSNGWDDQFRFGEGGEGVVLFGEIALKFKIGYINSCLYLYRRHSKQSSIQASNKTSIRIKKTFEIWGEKAKEGILPIEQFQMIFSFYNTRLRILQELGTLKHRLRYKPVKALTSIFNMAYLYIKSYPLIIFGTKRIEGII